MNRPQAERWGRYTTRLAWDKLRGARATLDRNGSPLRARLDLEGALAWAMEAWLARHGLRPDHSNGWFSAQAQFLGAAPPALADEVADCLSDLAAFGHGLNSPAPPGTGRWDSPRWRRETERCAGRTERLLLRLFQD